MLLFDLKKVFIRLALIFLATNQPTAAITETPTTPPTILAISIVSTWNQKLI